MIIVIVILEYLINERENEQDIVDGDIENVEKSLRRYQKGKERLIFMRYNSIISVRSN